MKIYFAAAIRGGRNDCEYYLLIISLLKKYGKVLTEHIGKREISAAGENKPPQYIYKRDIKWIDQADIFVADVTQPSIGVGYEIGVAEKLNKPILCLYRADGKARVSGMVQGNPNITFRTYKDIKEVGNIFKEFFGKQIESPPPTPSS